MSTSKKAKHSSCSPMGVPGATESYVCRLSQPFVANAIQENPSLWTEIPIPNGDELGSPICGADIHLPVLGREYIMSSANTDLGHTFTVYFFAYLHSLASLRIFHLKGMSYVYVCTDASDEVMRTVLALVQQILEQKYGPETMGNFMIYRDGER